MAGKGKSEDLPDNQEEQRAPQDEAGPDPVDVHVGKRMRMCRKMLNMTQTQLGKAVGVTFHFAI